jgi:hypothetical protein
LKKPELLELRLDGKLDLQPVAAEG